MTDYTQEIPFLDEDLYPDEYDMYDQSDPNGWLDDAYDDVCCFDIRYTGEPGTCRCKLEAEEERKAQKWHVKLARWWRNIVWKWRKRSAKERCTNCKKESLARKWNGNTCPNCGVEDLPF